MRFLAIASVAALVLGPPVWAQQPDTLRRPRTHADSVAKQRADSIAAADSIALMKALGAAGAAPDTSQRLAPTGQVGPTNPRLLPDVSAVGDFVGELSPDSSLQDNNTRLGVREVELAFQAVVDPYFRGDVFLGLNDLEKVSIEQAFLTTTSLRDLEIRLGRYLMPFGKQNTTHRHDLHTVEYPWVIQRFLSPDGLKGTGAYVSRVFAPFGFYQELQLTAVDRFGEAPEDLRTLQPVNRNLSGLGVEARFRNYWDVSQSTNVELSGSALTGDVAQPLSYIAGASGEVLTPTGVNAVGVRQSLVGMDFTFRWRPLQQGLYKSFIFQTEVMRQLNSRNPALPTCSELSLTPCTAILYAGPTRDFAGAYAFTRYQITARGFLGGRFDWVQDPLDPLGLGRTLTAGSGYFEWFPSEFSKLVAAYERYMPPGAKAANRILLQASFALGPHKPHPF
jgi:hypothetical protein